MPTYEYVCNGCGHEFEEFQSITAPSLKKCPKCGKLKLKRLIGTGAGVIFKGSGFYETDYRSDNYKKSAKAESDKQSPPKTDAAAAATTKSEGAAAKTESASSKSDAVATKSEPKAKPAGKGGKKGKE